VFIMRKQTLFAVGSALLALGMLPATPVFAASGGVTQPGGTVKSNSVTPLTIQNVGGGTWNYGASYEFPLGKHSWSHYVHPTNKHSATAICASSNIKVVAEKTIWANADARCGATSSSAQYWDNNA
jgi:hypothetical protein